MTDRLPETYDVAFYSGQLTGNEAREIVLLAQVLWERFRTEPHEVTMTGPNGPYKIVVRDSDVSNVLDVGCGMGAFLLAFRSLGVPKVTGVEHPHLYRTVGTAALPVGIPYEFRDLADPLPGVYLEVWDKCDLVLCLEVLEHLDAHGADQLALTLSRLHGRLVISAAVPGQGGTEHINERPLQYWVNKFADFGRTLNLEDTEWVRAEFRERSIRDHGSVYCEWYARNLMVFDPVRR